jgi:hypothetical protein
MGITCSARTLAIICFNHVWYSHLFDLASRSIARGGSVAGSPKVHGGDCLITLHTMTVLLDFTRCSPSSSSYIRPTFVCLSCTYNQLTHSHQHAQVSERAKIGSVAMDVEINRVRIEISN